MKITNFKSQTTMVKIQNRKEFVLNLKFRYLILFGICFLLFGASADSASADYYAQGILKSENLLSGADVTDIVSFDVTATIPVNTSVSVSFSQDRVNFYSSSGTKAAWDACANGTSSIDISGLGWSGGLLFYKLKLETTDELVTPVVSEVELTYEGEAVPPAGNARYVEGIILSTDLLENSANPLSGFEYFSYVISALPPSTNVYAQFSTDGINFYDSSGTKTAWDTLEFGEHLSEETSLNLSALNWKGQSSFYYKLKLTSKVDNKTTPVVKRAGLSSFAANIGKDSDDWLTDGLVGHWKMDEASWNSTAGEVVDASGNGNHGVASGGANTTGGKFGNGGRFDGADDIVNVGSAAGDELDIAGDMTVSLWFNADTWTDGSYNFLFRKNSPSQYNYEIIHDGTSQTIRFYSRDIDGTDYSAYIPRPATGGWHHVVGVRKNNNLEIYLNETKGTDAIAGPANTGAGNIIIGAVFPQLQQFSYDGNIDEVRVYNRALSAAEVRRLYEYAPGPVLHLKMDEMSGTTASDASGNGNGGTLVGGPVWGEGKFRGALSFDGVDDYVSITKDIININTVTVCAWINIPNVYQSNGAIVSDEDFHFAVNITDNPRERLGLSSNYHTTYAYSDTNSLSFGVWQYVCAVRLNDGSATFYIDGKQSGVASQNSGIPTNAYSYAPSIGSRTGAYALKGQIDDVRIYNYARTQKQILEDMNAGRPALEKPILDLSFDEGQGATAFDGSGNGNHGALVSGTTGTNTSVSAMWDKNGKFGGAMEFDGTNDRVVIADDPSLTQEKYTLSAWLKFNSYGVSDIILGKGAEFWITYNNQESYSGNCTANRLSFVSQHLNNFKCISSNNQPPLGKWLHVVGVHTGSEMRLYVDGELNDSVSHGPTSDGSYDFNIGSYDPDPSPYAYNGFVDEVKFYNYALSEDEIKTLYNGGTSLAMGGGDASANNDGVTVTGEATKYCIPGDTAKCDKPVLELDLDEMTGTVANDKSGNGNNGILNNGPTWDPVGKVGGALRFDGDNDYVRTLSSPLPDAVISEFTGSAWVKADNYNSGYIWELGGSDNFDLMWSDQIAGRVYCRIRDLTTGFYTTPLVDTGDLDWHYYSCVLDGDTHELSLYIDGIKRSSVDATGFTSFGVPQPLNIGARGNYNGVGAFGGTIDDVKFYNYARTPAQIAWDYNRGKPIAHWKMDETSGTQVDDWSGFGNHGTMISMDPATDRVDGKNNKALDFDGAGDYVDAGETMPLQAYTKTAWIKRRAGNNQNNIISGDTGHAFWTPYNYSNICAFCLAAGNVGPFNAVRDTEAIEVEKWYHVAVSYDPNVNSGEMKLYKEGVMVDSATGVTGNTDSTTYIGRWGGGFTFNGQIDDVKIYNYALTEEQIKLDYNGGAVNFR